MSSYEWVYEDKKIILESEKCSMFLNDEDNPISGVTVEEILELLKESERVESSMAYYDQGCEVCHKNKSDTSHSYRFLEFHFYLFAKEGKYVMSSLSKSYEDKTLPRLLNEGTVNGTYIASINICENCGDYTIDLEYGLF
ncbi:DUF3785 family protein [Petrocella sp. FN5]|uniref:DUF3785 family protein n=1 Tax=Petrocella sp. FN5 TaxID=3032002 RepID=UPI0023D98F20|nr:DUF3785 family protein [Petrocella sp. FN5]MDF1617692.1 DUF3785 family protein [Petrocella sp. FN5]